MNSARVRWSGRTYKDMTLDTATNTAPRFAQFASAIAAITLCILTVMMSANAFADPPCEGHQLLPLARPASSCKDLTPSAFQSPNGRLTALVFSMDPSLHATPDMESRVDIRDRHRTLASKDYSSPRGANGYYVVRANWTPDSKFFVFSLSSSGGHSPWSFPIWAYSRDRNIFTSFSAMIEGNPTLSENFELIEPHMIIATTWRDRDIEKARSVTIDLEDAFTKLRH